MEERLEEVQGRLRTAGAVARAAVAREAPCEAPFYSC